MKRLLCLALLSACSAAQPLAEPVTVKVPVEVPCFYAPVISPDWNATRLAGNADSLARLRALLADLALAQGYIGELEAALTACS